MSQKKITLAPGIRAVEHSTRRHGLKLDRYFYLRFSADGRQIEEGLGWASQGWTLEKAQTELAKLKTAKATGTGPITLQERKTQANAERQAVAQRLTVTDLWKCYLDIKGDYASRYGDASSFKHLEPLHDRHPETLRTIDVTKMAKALTDKGLKPQTVKHALALLRRILRFGVAQELCTHSQSLRFIMPVVDNTVTECLTPLQLQKLLTVLDEDPDQNLASLMRLALATGMRRGALVALKWADLDFEKELITLRGESAKNGKTCTIPMTKSAREVLEKIEATNSPYLFPGKTENPRREFRRFIERVRVKAEFPPGFRPLHGLRHTFASLLASSGQVTLYDLQKLLTHGSSVTTERYAHLTDNALRRAASTIDDILKPKTNPEPEPTAPNVLQFRRKAG